jgi:hypothetical protein
MHMLKKYAMHTDLTNHQSYRVWIKQSKYHRLWSFCPTSLLSPLFSTLLFVCKNMTFPLSNLMERG